MQFIAIMVPVVMVGAGAWIFGFCYGVHCRPRSLRAESRAALLRVRSWVMGVYTDRSYGSSDAARDILDVIERGRL